MRLKTDKSEARDALTAWRNPKTPTVKMRLKKTVFFYAIGLFIEILIFK